MINRQYKKNSNYVIATFDPGYSNFAFAVEEFNAMNIIENHTSIPDKTIRYNNGKASTLFQNFINENIYKNGTLLYANCIDFSRGKNIKAWTSDLLAPINNFLLSNDELWKVCDVFVIERQLKLNPKAIRISHHIESFFSIKYPEKKILYIMSNRKTRVLGCDYDISKSVNKKSIKTWSIGIAKDILKLRDDKEAYKCIFEKYERKKDDISDCILMLQAIKILIFCDGKI